MSEAIDLIYDLQLRTLNAMEDIKLFRITADNDLYALGYADGMIYAAETILKYLSIYASKID